MKTTSSISFCLFLIASFFLTAQTGTICHFNLQNKSFELRVAARCSRSLCVLCECHVLSVTFSQGPHSQILSAGEQQMGSWNLKRNRRDIGSDWEVWGDSSPSVFTQVRLIRQRNPNETVWKIAFAAEGPGGAEDLSKGSCSINSSLSSEDFQFWKFVFIS